MSSDPAAAAGFEDLYIDSFKNAKFDTGIVFEVKGTLVVSISSDNADITNWTKREPMEVEPIVLSSGNYVAGTDFPAGTYNITCTKGTGNISSSNLFDGGINEIFGEKNDTIHINSFSNAVLKDGDTLELSGITVTLTQVG